jgi:uncharacterized RmlC-like cupin family protein
MDPAKIVTVRSKCSHNTKQEFQNFEGISAHSAGTTEICIHLLVIPPGGQAPSPIHKGCETAIYIVKGRAKAKSGEGLKLSSINAAGDFICNPADEPPQPVTLRDTQAVIAIVARSDPNEQESVVIYTP